MLSTKSVFIPICVYTQTVDGTSRVRLEYPNITLHQGETFYSPWFTNGPTSKNNYWKYSFTFLAISPLVRPIPRGMNLIRAELSPSFPYATTSIYAVYDPFTVPSSNVSYVSFITYTQPVPNTIKIYIECGGDVVDGKYTAVTRVSLTASTTVAKHFAFPEPLKAIYAFTSPTFFVCLNNRILPNNLGQELEIINPQCTTKQFSIMDYAQNNFQGP